MRGKFAQAYKFQSTLPRGERRSRNMARKLSSKVSIHAPAWGATSDGAGRPHCRQVSIHAPAWGATAVGDAARDAVGVSIHAPAWGATNSLPELRRAMAVSIHAPAWGATGEGGTLDACLPRFNPRSRVGSDASNWAASVPTARFQSTLPRGERLTATMHFLFTSKFQSTLPRGERRQFVSRRAVSFSFNPRSRVGSDCALLSVCPKSLYVSIHAPAWGATPVRTLCRRTTLLFQSTLPRGERHQLPRIAHWSKSFNPRSRVGSDWRRTGSWSNRMQFQSTLPRGERQIVKGPPAAFGGFNPRSRVGSDHRAKNRAAQERGFNPRSRVGSDLREFIQRASWRGFQSTLPRGERPQWLRSWPTT